MYKRRKGKKRICDHEEQEQIETGAERTVLSVWRDYRIQHVGNFGFPSVARVAISKTRLTFSNSFAEHSTKFFARIAFFTATPYGTLKLHQRATFVLYG